MKYTKILISIVLFFGILFSLQSCIQEKLLFYPESLSNDFQFKFDNDFEEYFIKVDEKTELNGLLFKSDSSKGLVFYLHGNAGSLRLWGSVAETYLENNYDIFILDYRGFGKSQGKISGEKKFHNDIQIVYDSLASIYSDENIIVLGFSIGTGPATYLASNNSPKLLILLAPYYNLGDLAKKHIGVNPGIFLKYKFKTNKYITEVDCPIIIFHGNRDEVIYSGSSFKLKELFKETDSLIILKEQKHNGIDYNPEYKTGLKIILE